MLSVASFSQLKKAAMHVSDSTTNFNASLPDGYIVFDEGTNKFWRITQVAHGTDNLSTVTKIDVSNSQSLSSVLSFGNNTGTYNIVVDSGQVIKSGKGNSIVDFSYLGDTTNLSLYTGSHSAVAIGTEGFIDFTPTSLGLGHGNAYVSLSDYDGITGTVSLGYYSATGSHSSYASMTDNSCGLSILNSTYSKGGTIQVKETDSGGWTTYYPNVYPSVVSSALLTVDSGVLNSAAIGGKNIKMKTNGLTYVNKIGFNTGLAGEMVLVHTPSATDYTATLQAKTHTIAGLDDISTSLNSKVFIEINIGDWDMDTDGTVSVVHSLSATEWKTVRDINVMIRNDADVQYFVIDNKLAGGSETPYRYVDSTNFVLFRDSGGGFDNVNFDSTSYNRGFISFWYTPD